jgi:hypothetical protein
MTFDQSGFDVRCEWGENGVRHLAPGADFGGQRIPQPNNMTKKRGQICYGYS